VWLGLLIQNINVSKLSNFVSVKIFKVKIEKIPNNNLPCEKIPKCQKSKSLKVPSGKNYFFSLLNVHEQLNTEELKN
jgi:hypothetical protein